MDADIREEYVVQLFWKSFYRKIEILNYVRRFDFLVDHPDLFQHQNPWQILRQICWYNFELENLIQTKQRAIVPTTSRPRTRSKWWAQLGTSLPWVIILIAACVFLKKSEM